MTCGNCCCAKQVLLYIEKWQEQDELKFSSRAGLPVNDRPEWQQEMRNNLVRF
jgi:hypothetical protein